MPMHVGGEITVRVVVPTPLRAPSIEGFEQRLPLDGSKPIDAHRRRPSQHQRADVTTVGRSRCSDALALLQGPTPLLGLLTVLELTLEQPVAMPPELAAAVKSTTDELVPNFLALLQRPSELDAPTALRVFGHLRHRSINASSAAARTRTLVANTRFRRMAQSRRTRSWISGIEAEEQLEALIDSGELVFRHTAIQATDPPLVDGPNVVDERKRRLR